MFTLATVTDVDYLPFIELGNTTNVIRKELPPADDSSSTDIDIPIGFAFGNTFQKTVYVSYLRIRCVSTYFTKPIIRFMAG